MSNDPCSATDIDRRRLSLSTRRRSSLRLVGGYESWERQSPDWLGRLDL
jgi:hypothetical protein